MFSYIFLFAITAAACSDRPQEDSIKVVDSIPTQGKLNNDDRIKPLSDSGFMHKDTLNKIDSSNITAKEKKFKELSTKKKTSQDELTKRMQKGAETQFHPHILKGDTAK